MNNNRFKFRIRDISGQDWMVPKKVELSNDEFEGEVVLYFSKYNYTTLDWAIENTQDFVVQQWTGMLDKNGKEIYEGDVVCIDMNNIDTNKRGTTLFENGKFVFVFRYVPHDDLEGRGKLFTYSVSELHNQVEVVGNIYSIKL